MSSRIDELDAIVRQFDLNEHPFYTEWRAGTLPVERLAEYADEWAPFICVVDQAGSGSAIRGTPPRSASTTRSGGVPCRARRDGARCAARSRRRCWPWVSRHSHRCRRRSARSTASRSSSRRPRRRKLDGLREHYAGTVDADAQQYFVEHAVETDEPAMLAALIDGLSDGEFARAKTACAIFSAAAWGALDGVYYTD